MLSFSFAYSAIKAMKLDGFLTGAALLTGLFLYDIFWVFGTPVVSSMIAVKNIADPLIDGERCEKLGCTDKGKRCRSMRNP